VKNGITRGRAGAEGMKRIDTGGAGLTAEEEDNVLTVVRGP